MACPDEYWGSYAHGRRKASQETERIKDENRRLTSEMEKLKRKIETLEKALTEARKKE